MTTIAEAAELMILVVGQLTSLKDELSDWASGTLTGGPGGDGLYPFTQADATVFMAPSLPKMSALLAGKYDSLFQAATAQLDATRLWLAASDQSVNQVKSWMAGAANGGPFGTGLFPIRLSTGATVNVPSPARIKADHASVTSIIGTSSLIAMVEGRVYATYAGLLATSAINDKWALVHSDTDMGRNGYYLGQGAAWVMKVSLASEALLVALGDNLRAPVITQLIGRPTEPSKVAAAVTGTNLFLWNDPVAAGGRVTGLRLFAAATGTIRLQSYSVAGATATKKRSTTLTVTAIGMQTLPVDLIADAGDYIGITGANILTSTSAAADGGGWYQFHPDPDTRPLGSLNTTTRLEAQFQIATMQQTVNAQAFGDAVTHIADLLARTAMLEAQTSLLQGSVVQQIGLPADVAPQNGSGAADQMFIWADPVARDGTLETVRFYATATGSVSIARYSRVGTTVTREAMVTLSITSTGLKTLTAADFGAFPVKAAEHLAIHGYGVMTSKNEPADGAGWWQVNAVVPVRTVGAATTAIRLHAGFSVREPIQFVTAARLKAIEDQGADHEARLSEMEPNLALLSADVVQTIGRRGEPESGNPVNNSVYIWNAPIDQDGMLSLVNIYVNTPGTFTLVRWSRAGSTVTRRDVRTINAVATGAQAFTPADFGGPMQVEAGNLIGLSGTGLFNSTPGSTDDGGWWQVVDGLDVRTLGTLFTSNRLEASFRIDQNYQVVTAEDYLALKQEVEELKSSGTGSEIPDGALVRSTDWFNQELAEAHKAPLIGGRAGQRMTRAIGKRTLAHIATVADVQGGGSITGLTDDASEPLYGPAGLKLVTTGGTMATLAPAVPNTVPTDVRGGMIRWMLKPLGNIFAGIDRFSIELHSAGSPSAPTGNYHQLVPTTAPYDLRQRLTSANGVGRWQGYSVAVSQFTAVGSGANLSAILWARLNFRTLSGQSASLLIGNIEFVPSKLAKAKCVISFDDGRLAQITYVAAKMARYGFPAVLFPSPVAMSTDVSSIYLTSAQIKSLHDNLGWQVGSQAWTTESQAIIDAMTENQFTAELAKLRNWHNAMGLTGGEHGSYFSGVTALDMIAFPAFRKHFRSMRAYFGGNASGAPLTYGETFPFGDPMQIRAYGPELLDTAANATQVVAHAQQAITDKGVAYFGYHDPTLSSNIQTGFEALLAFLDANRAVIDVVTEEDLMNG